MMEEGNSHRHRFVPDRCPSSLNWWISRTKSSSSLSPTNRRGVRSFTWKVGQPTQSFACFLNYGVVYQTWAKIYLNCDFFLRQWKNILKTKIFVKTICCINFSGHFRRKVILCIWIRFIILSVETNGEKNICLFILLTLIFTRDLTLPWSFKHYNNISSLLYSKGVFLTL